MSAKWNRQHSVVAVAVVLLGGLAAGATYWRGMRSAARLSVEASEVVLPKCPIGQVHPISVSVRNCGGSALRLRIGGVSCGCGKVQIEKTELLAGESCRLVGTIQAKVASGPFSSRIALISNDPDRPLTEIVVRGEVEPYFTISPPTVTLAPDMCESGAAPLRIRSTANTPVNLSVRVTGVTAQSSKSKVTLQPGQTIVVDFSCARNIIQYQEGQIYLETDHNLQRVLTVPIQVVPKRGLEVHPAKVRFGMISRSEAMTRRFPVFLRGSLAQSAAITDISVPSFLRVVAKRKANTGATQIDFALSPKCPTGAINGTVTLHVSLEHQAITDAIVTVPVGGIVQ